MIIRNKKKKLTNQSPHSRKKRTCDMQALIQPFQPLKHLFEEEHLPRLSVISFLVQSSNSYNPNLWHNWVSALSFPSIDSGFVLPLWHLVLPVYLGHLDLALTTTRAYCGLVLELFIRFFSYFQIHFEKELLFLIAISIEKCQKQ